MAKFNNQDNEDLTKLQLEAAKRVREMQSKIKKTVQNEQLISNNKKPAPKENKSDINHEQPISNIISNKKKVSSFEEILKDNDKLLIIALILILLGEEDNMWILLALVYLIF